MASRFVLLALTLSIGLVALGGCSSQPDANSMVESQKEIDDANRKAGVETRGD